jgi:uncharacterized protein YfaS (alpha-2-macroglobulin family)
MKDRIAVNPRIHFGKPCVAGTRISVQSVLELVREGLSFAKRYVLPKFKVEVKTDKTFYLPKEKIAVDLQSDYFFGKPVANSPVEVSASTFDVAFKEFTKWKGMTDANGHVKFEIQLPD